MWNVTTSCSTTSAADPRRPAIRFAQGLRALFACLFAVVLAACGDRDIIHVLEGHTMGTTWAVKVVAPAGERRTERLQQELEALLEDVNRQMSTWRDDSDITRFNRAEAGSWVFIPPEFWYVLNYARTLAEQTEGAYDPTVGPLVNLWGFGAGVEGDGTPTAEEIAAMRERVGWHRILFEQQNGAVLQPGGLYLDLSSVAKGYAVDKLANHLLKGGYASWLVEIGGELRGRGRKPDGSRWRIAIERPEAGVRRAGRIVELDELAIATSGDYRNFREVDGELVSHLIDPRTGRPVPHQLASVTVLADNCMEADALATALSVLGPDEGMAFAREHEVAVLMVVREQGELVEYTSAAFDALNQVQEVAP